LRDSLELIKGWACRLRSARFRRWRAQRVAANQADVFGASLLVM
jgi:hypothetical protein